jgi:hypothetical protein
MFSLHFSSPPCSVQTLQVALREAADVADNVRTWSWRGAGRVSRAGRAGRAGMGRVEPGCTVQWLTIFDPKGLCRFGVKNARGVVSR